MGLSLTCSNNLATYSPTIPMPIKLMDENIPIIKMVENHPAGKVKSKNNTPDKNENYVA